MRNYVIQAINGGLYIAAQTNKTLLLRELPAEELVQIMLNETTEVYGGNSRMQTIALTTDHAITVRERN